jgi:hypothetical protein
VIVVQDLKLHFDEFQFRLVLFLGFGWGRVGLDFGGLVFRVMDDYTCHTYLCELYVM